MRSLFLPALALTLATLVHGAEPLPADPRFAAATALSRDAGGIALLVMLDGKIVHEDYPNGGAPDRATELASGTKSFSGVLALCAVEDKLLTLDEKVSATLAEWRDDEARRDLTIRQLLTLTSGIPGGPSAARGGGVPSYRDAVAVKAVAAPGARYSYGPQPFQIFGAVLQRKLAARGETVAGYLKKKILAPLAMQPPRWRKDADGQPHLPSGAALSARDWVKFGEAIRLDGKGLLTPGKLGPLWEGTKANPGYGLTWWLPGEAPYGAVARRDLRGAGLPKDIRMAAGLGGQRLVVVPSLKLVAVRLAPVRGGAERLDDRAWLRALLGPLKVTGARP